MVRDLALIERQYTGTSISATCAWTGRTHLEGPGLLCRPEGRLYITPKFTGSYHPISLVCRYLLITYCYYAIRHAGLAPAFCRTCPESPDGLWNSAAAARLYWGTLHYMPKAFYKWNLSFSRRSGSLIGWGTIVRG